MMRVGSTPCGSTASALSSLIGTPSVSIKGKNVLSGPISVDSVHISLDGAISNLSELQKDNESSIQVLARLYESQGPSCLHTVVGQYGFTLLDESRDRWLSARDPLGAKPLYYGMADDGGIYLSSAIKSLVHHCKHLEVFPPGYMFDSDTWALERYYNPSWMEEAAEVEAVPEQEVLDVLAQSVDSMKSGLVLDGAYSELLRKVSPELPVHVITLGDSSSDSSYTITEVVESLHRLVYEVESYDVDTVRAALPLYLLGSRLKASGVDSILHACGGAAVCSHDARGLQKVGNTSSALSKAMSCWGIEMRFPFLNSKLVDMVMSSGTGIPVAELDSTPTESALVVALQQYAEKQVTDAMMTAARFRFPYNTPSSKEAYLYRLLFEGHFPSEAAVATVPCYT